MNKAELIDAIAKHADISKRPQVARSTQPVTPSQAPLKKGTMVTLVGFGSFYVGKRARRAIRAPARRSRSAPRKIPKFPRWKSV